MLVGGWGVMRMASVQGDAYSNKLRVWEEGIADRALPGRTLYVTGIITMACGGFLVGGSLLRTRGDEAEQASAHRG